MNDILKLGFRLFIFALVAAAGLAVTNEVTKGPIAEQKLAAKRAALETVLPNSEYEQIEYENLEDGSELDEIFAAKDANGNVKGYALTASPQGYGGEIPITMGISTGGYVTQVYVGALQETAGLGSRVGDAPFKEQFIGIAADPDTLRSDVDKISGASVSSGAFLNASEQILSYTKKSLGIEPHAGDKDAILAAAAAANGGEEAEGGETVATDAAEGGAVTYEVTGFQPFKVAIETDADGKIVSVTVPEHNETPGLGADLIADAAVFEALAGQDIASAKIDVKAGVTLTSNAINDALAQAAAKAASGPKTYEVTGFQPLKVAIETDADGKIISVTVPEHNETPGLGADLIADAAVFEALAGQDIASAKIDIKTGVTLTSNAINDALALAAKDAAGGSETEAAVQLPAGDAYTVKGFNKFTAYVDVENGVIASIEIPEHQETPALGGTLIEEVLPALAGGELASAEIDAKAGVTLTSNALKQVLDLAAAANGIVRENPTQSTEEPATEEVSSEETTSEEASLDNAKIYEVTGFQPFKVAIETDADGKIVSVTVPENNETPGFGADLIADAAVFEELAGKDIREAKIDVKSGATLTSNAINDALAQAAKDAPAAEAPVEETPAEETATEETATEETSAEATAEGNVKTYEVTGFQPFKVAIETDADGKIVSVTIPENNETPGFGADLIADAAVFEALAGKDIREAKIDVKSGATLTSNAINDALAQAAKDAQVADNTAAGNAKTYEVTGFQPFKVAIETDADGKIVSVTVPENNETPGFGADLIADTAVFEALAGKDIREAKIDVKSGATLTSNAINDALAQAAKEAE